MIEDMTRLSPMAGELAAGIMGRYRILHGFDTSREMIAYLRARSNLDVGNATKIPVLVLLADALGMSTEQLAKSHSLIPIVRAIAEGQEHPHHGDQSEPLILKYSGMRMMGKFSNLCHQCIEDDSNESEPTYWRREHQIYGLTICPDHLVPLRYVELPNAFDFLPEHLLEVSKEYPITASVAENPVVKRYVEIITAFLQFDRPIPAASISKMLNQQAQLIGIRVGQTGLRKLISDYAIEQAPREWLEMYFPKVCNKQIGRYISSLDGVVNASNKPFAVQSYALAAALLWDTSESALTSISNCTREYSYQGRQLACYGWNYWTDKQMFDAYVRHQGNVTAIARQANLSKSNFFTQLEQYGYPALGNCDWEREIPAIRAFFNGDGLQEACNEFGTSIQAVEKLLRSAGSIFGRALEEMDR